VVPLPARPTPEPRELTVSDYFSPLARRYALFRPAYPEELFDWLAALAPRRRLAWEAGAGSGQATRGLAARFERVVATDSSAAQLREAPELPDVEYRVTAAESSGLEPACADLVAAAQALHWFDIPRFWEEARRVLSPRGAIAVWTYGNARLGNPVLDRQFGRFREEVVGAWWPPQRALVEDRYRSLDFPFAEIAAPPFRMEASLTLDELLGYVETWSAVTRYRAGAGGDPLALLRSALAPGWGAREQRRSVTWPLSVRAGRPG
jgi:SAM-dependent methyltransferase